MAEQWKFERMKGFEERAEILKQPIAEHDGYFRENNGDWIVGDGEGRVASVRFCGTAKRGQAFNAPDPEGMRRARLIAAAPQLLQAVKDAWLQIDYLHNKFSETGTGNTVLQRLSAAIELADLTPPPPAAGDARENDGTAAARKD